MFTISSKSFLLYNLVNYGLGLQLDSPCFLVGQSLPPPPTPTQKKKKKNCTKREGTRGLFYTDLDYEMIPLVWRMKKL